MAPKIFFFLKKVPVNFTVQTVLLNTVLNPLSLAQVMTNDNIKSPRSPFHVCTHSFSIRDA